jgi:hypothetical protein
LGRATSGKQLRLRENYIINREGDYNRLKGEMQNLINSPKFNRFISLKKTPLNNAENIIKYTHKEQPKRRPLEGAFNRRQLHCMRQRRPDHNSPLRVRPEAKGGEILVEDEEENAMLIKQLVTHL